MRLPPSTFTLLLTAPPPLTINAALYNDIPRKAPAVTFTITSAAGASFVYAAAANHDMDRDSNGTVIRIWRP